MLKDRSFVNNLGLKRHKKARYGRCEAVKLRGEMNGSGRAAPDHSGWAASLFSRENLGGKFKFWREI